MNSSLSATWSFAWQLLAPDRRRLTGLIAGLVVLDTGVRLSLAAGGWGLQRHGWLGLAVAGGGGMIVMAARTQLARVTRRALSQAYYRATTEQIATIGALTGPSKESARFERQLFGTGWKYGQLMSGHIPGFLGGTVTLLIVASWLLPKLSMEHLLVGTIALALVAPYVVWLQRKVQAAQRKSIATHHELASEFGLLVRGHDELTAADLVDTQAQRSAKLAERAASLQSHVAWLQSLTGRGPILVAGAAAAVMLGWWANIETPTLDQASTLIIAGSLLPASVALLRALPAIGTTIADIEALREMMQRKTDPVSPDKPSAIHWDDTIRLHKVTFAYDEADAPVLEDVSLTWKPGEVLCITGPNGSGKSTLFRLLLRLADPQAGSLYIGSTDLRSVDVELWRRGIAHLPQRLYLPERMTVQEVFERLAPRTASDRLVSALDQVNLKDKLERLGEGNPLRAPVQRLSAGQQQRLALAMVLASEAHVLLLDEPDASLDSQGLNFLVDQMKSLSKRARILLIAHHPQLIACADRVFTLQSEKKTRNVEEQHLHLS